MKGPGTFIGVLLLAALVLEGCGSSEETTVRPTATILTKEALYLEGHQLYLQQSYDSAAVLLKRSSAMDSTYQDPIKDLAQLYYEQGMKAGTERGSAKGQSLRQARTYFAYLERQGVTEADIYERLCEVSVALDDDRSFLRYAKRYADLYPYDRQSYNLGVAYFNAGDYQQTIKSQREAKEKFKDSPYLGGFYRQMGRAYRKVDRDQTAERTFTEGVKAVDGRIAELRKTDPAYRSSTDYRRLLDDKIAMLQELKRLHQIYKAQDKLAQVERQLKELGHDK
jgi:tetratricopeptide (TPR) repeat protein